MPRKEAKADLFLFQQIVPRQKIGHRHLEGLPAVLLLQRFILCADLGVCHRQLSIVDRQGRADVAIQIKQVDFKDVPAGEYRSKACLSCPHYLGLRLILANSDAIVEIRIQEDYLTIQTRHNLPQ
jgi:hypothetical protein